MAGSKVYITLDVDDKGSATMRKFGGNADKAFDKLKKNSNAGATQAGKMERAWRSSINHLKKHWKAYAVAGAAAIYGVTRAISGAVTKMKEYVELANVQEKAERKLGAVLKATGNAAGYNLEQLKKMASGMQSVTTVGDEVTLGGMAILATFKQIRGEGFERATKAALDMSAVMGTDLKGSMIMIGKAVNDPITGMSMLTRVGVTFTQQQKDMARQLQESGDMAGAQNIILKEMESQFGGTAAALRKDFGGAVEAANNALGDTKEEMGFLITKNQFFVDIIALAEKQFIAWGEKIKENRGYLQELLKSGILKLIDGIIFAIETMRFFHNAWLGIKLVGTAALHAVAVGIDELVGGIRFLFTPLNLLFEGLKKLGAIKVNPFDEIEKSLGQFRVSSADVTKDVLKDIKKTNKTYDLVIDKIEGWQKAVKAIPVEQTKTERQITKSIKAIGEVQATQTKAELKAAKDAAKAAAKAAADKEKLVMNFSDKYQKLILGDYEYAVKKIEEQGQIYKSAGADRIEVEKWVSAEIGNLISEEAKAAALAAAEKARAVEDYARESTKIYERMFDDIQRLDLNDLEYKTQLLSQRYNNYKLHLESLAVQNTKYADGVLLLDKWLDAEKQQLWDDWARDHGSVLERMEVQWRDYQEEAITASSIAYDTINAGAKNLEQQLSDNLFNVLAGHMDKTKLDWDSLWNSMIRTVTDSVARMAAEFASAAAVEWMTAIFAAKGIWDVKGDEIPVIAHEGEMIIPALLAEKIRGGIAGSSYGSEFTELSTKADDIGNNVKKGFIEGTIGTYAKISGVGAAMMLGGNISAEQYMQGMIDPNTVAMSVFTGGVPKAVISGMGLEGKWSDTGQFLGMAALMATGAPGILAAMLGKPLGAYMFDAIGDALNLRGMEDIRDYFETEFGYFEGRRAFQKFLAGLKTAGYDRSDAQSYLTQSELDSIFGTGSLGGAGSGGKGYGFGGGVGAGHGGGGYGGFGSSYGGGFGGGMGGAVAREGGIFHGSESGYPMTLHGEEAVIPLKGGKVPVSIQSNNRNDNITIPITIVTPDGKVLMEQTIEMTFDELESRSERGEIVIHAGGVA